MTWSPIGIFRPGSTIVHRMRPGAKLLGLIALSVTLVWVRTPLMTATALAFVLLTAAVGRVRVSDLLRMLRGFALIAVVLVAFHVWQNGLVHAWVIVGTLMTLIIAATVVTATTHADDMIATLTWTLSPFRIFGLKPEKVALAFALTLRTIPTVFDLARDTREAARARGLERSLRVYVNPLVIRSVAHARALGEALQARGLDDG